VVAGVDRDERERAALEQKRRGERGRDPADARGRTSRDAEAHGGVGAEEHREVRGTDERAERRAAEHPWKALLELGVLEADEALPRATEEQRRVPEAAEHEGEERRADDRRPVERGGIHGGSRAGAHTARGRFRDEGADPEDEHALAEDEPAATFG
jgi:hypothetical protein